MSAPKPRRERMLPWKLYMDRRTRENLRVKAAAHGVTRPNFVRSLINGHRPGSLPGSRTALADAWWDSRTPARRESIWRNHAAADAARDAADGRQDQLTIEDVFGGGDA